MMHSDFDPKVAHLLRRATLGPTFEEIVAASEAGLEPTLDAMLRSLDEPLSQRQAAAQAIGDVFLKDGRSLRAGWMLRILNVPNLFREKLTLFWHDHFATAISKVNDPRLMAGQIDTLRELALGPFDQLALAMARDPAMLIWLDNQFNVAGKPNENFARELMELFTLGIGNYSEKDVQEVARAFTGWTLERKRFVFDPARHDSGEKEILGQSGNLDGSDVIGLLGRQDAAPRFIARKLWRFFVSQEPGDDDLAALIEAYRANAGSIKAMVRAMFLSPRFFAPEVIARQIKNPIEFVVGAIRALSGPLADVQKYADAASAMGMDLYNPPDVSGWAGGEQWISSFTLLERIRLVRQLIGKGREGQVCGLDVNRIIADNFFSDNEELVDHFSLRFLHRPADAKLRRTLLEYLTAGARAAVIKLPARQRDEKLRGLIRLILCSPQYQLC